MGWVHRPTPTLHRNRPSRNAVVTPVETPSQLAGVLVDPRLAGRPRNQTPLHWLADGWALRREHLRTALGDVQTVFEPNAEELWARVRRSITSFLTTVWRNGALEGTSVDQAFFVKCDRTTMTQSDLDNGRLVCLVGIAPIRPAEFVIIRIGQWTADRKPPAP